MAHAPKPTGVMAKSEFPRTLVFIIFVELTQNQIKSIPNIVVDRLCPNPLKNLAGLSRGAAFC